MKNLKGMKFGMLTAFEKTEKRSGGCVVWKCKCECGNTVFASSAELTSSKKRSCGCLERERRTGNFNDLTGQKFGKLTVIERGADYISRKGKHFTRWKCKCECGESTTVLANSLRRGLTTSCGRCGSKNDAIKKLNDSLKDGLCEGTNVRLLNQNSRKNNTSGRVGVSFRERQNDYIAYISFKKHRYHLGVHKNLEDAIKARARAEEQLHGKFLEWYAREYPDKWEKIKRD